MNKSLIVVDCQYDFIDGSLACINAENAVKNIIDFINENPKLNVYYSCDWHSENNKSFKRHGGIWPDHCVQNKRGSEIHKDFYSKIKKKKTDPIRTISSTKVRMMKLKNIPLLRLRMQKDRSLKISQIRKS